MANISPSTNRNVDPFGGVVAVTWGPMLNGDVGLPVSLANYSDKTFQVSGTLGAAGALLIEGSNDAVNWVSLANRQGTAMSFTTLSQNTSQDRPLWVRPRVTAGDGTTSLTCIAACHRSDFGGPAGG